MKPLAICTLVMATLLVGGFPAAAVEPPADDSAYAIRGQCIDHGDNSPRANVRVRLARFAGRTAPAEIIAETVTDADGRYEFLDLEPPRPDERIDRLEYALFAQAEGGPISIGGLGPAIPGQYDPFKIRLVRDKVTLRGRIADAAGQPVAGAIVAQFTLGGRHVPGVLCGTTDADGVFAVDDVFVLSRARGFDVHVTVIHPDHPTIGAQCLQPVLAIQLPKACSVVGTVVDEVDERPITGAVVTFQRTDEGVQTATASEDGVTIQDANVGEIVVETDAEGRLRVAVAEGRYNITAESADRVCAARTDQELIAGQTVELPPFAMIEGGYILGRVANPATGAPVSHTDDGQPIAIGLFGPATPAEERVIRPTPLATVDEDGRFLLRVAPGDNFPYFVNMHGDRMAWDTRNKPAVVVRAGETTACAMTINLPDDPASRLQAAAKLVAELPADPAQRVDRILAEFRRLNHTVDETELWCTLMRELVKTGGRDAVPALCAELDRTIENRMLRRLAFALRAIGDPRAVPALIRAIPRTLQPSSSDYGFIVADADLAAFMQRHDLRDGGGQYFNFGRPVREVFGALHELTGQNFRDDELNWISRREDPRSAAMQRQLFQRHAERWKTWWDAHSSEFTDDPAYQAVNLPPLQEPLPPALELGPGARFDSGLEGAVLSPPGVDAPANGYFLDLDTGYQPFWPDRFPQDASQLDFDKLRAWARGEGVDLMCLVERQPDGSDAYVLRGIDLKAAEIGPREVRNLKKSLDEGKLPAGTPTVDLLIHVDPDRGNPVADANAAFLYTTREGGRGLIETTDRVTRGPNVGAFMAAPRGVGFHKGVRFNWTPIAPK